MSSNQSPLKIQNQTYITAILFIDIAAIFFTVYHTQIIPLLAFRLLTLNTGLCVAGGAVFTLLINHSMPRWIKEIVVHLRVKDVQPACRAFSKRILKDKRIDVNALQKILGTFPTVADEQNRLWYRLFKQQESKASIQYAHQMYLLFRDGASISLMIFLLFTLPLFLYAPSTATASILGLMFAQYIIFVIAASNSGNSLVDNVLAEASVSTITV